MILGIDEVGRGPWAGPLVVGAVVLPDGYSLEGLTDSKKLSAKKRVELDARIRADACGYGLGWVYPAELDAIGLSAALRQATIRAVQNISVPYHQIIIDGTVNFLRETNKGNFVQTLPKADALIPAVSAASIIAKVARDAYMARQDEIYPEYGFGSHVGYGTAKHRQALERYGVTPLHRTSFAPIARLLGGMGAVADADTETKVKVEAKAKTKAKAKASGSNLYPNETSKNNKTTKAIGDKAEDDVATWLESNGFRIVERNWRTRRCEIDCIADKNDTRFFIEVKYRSSQHYGGGVAAITPKKLQQMSFAAELYSASHSYSGNAQLAVISVNARRNIALIEVT